MNFFFERNLNEMISSLSNENNNFKRNWQRLIQITGYFYSNVYRRNIYFQISIQDEFFFKRDLFIFSTTNNTLFNSVRLHKSAG